MRKRHLMFRHDDNEFRYMAELQTGVMVYYDCGCAPSGMPWLRLTNKAGRTMPLARQAIILDAYPALLHDIEARQDRERARWNVERQHLQSIRDGDKRWEPGAPRVLEPLMVKIH